MSTKLYPSDLPLPEVQSYSHAPQRHFDSTPVAVGLPYFRQRQVNPPWNVQVQWMYDEAGGEWSRFQDWYKNTLNWGVEWFTTELLVGTGLHTHECHFLSPESPWTHTTQGVIHVVSATLIAKYATDSIFPVPPANLNIRDARTTNAPAADIMDATNDLANPPADIIDAGLAVNN